MSYLVYGAWAGLFYLALGFLHTGAPGNHPPGWWLVLTALVMPALLKRNLPVLKGMRFPEVSGFFRGLHDRSSNVLIKERECSVCRRKTGFPIQFGYDVKKNLNPRRWALFCRHDGLEELREKLKTYPGKILFAEPRSGRFSGSFFYEPKEMRIHGYPKTDQAGAEERLEKVSRAGRRIAWIPQENIGEPGQNHVFLEGKEGMEEVEIEELITRLDRVLFEMERRHGKGEYQFTEPRGGGGIYLWQEI